MLCNTPTECLVCWQTLCDGVREAYHWDNTDVEDRLQIRPLDGVWDWSGSFEIDKAGEFGIRVRNAGTRKRPNSGFRTLSFEWPVWSSTSVRYMAPRDPEI